MLCCAVLRAVCCVLVPHAVPARHGGPAPAIPLVQPLLLPQCQVIDKLVADPALGRHLTNPSVSYGSTNLYMRGALEAETRPNLDKVRHYRGA